MEGTLKQKIVDTIEMSLKDLKTTNGLKMFCNDHVRENADQVLLVGLDIDLIYNQIESQKSKEPTKFRKLVEEFNLLYEKQQSLYVRLLAWKEMYDELNEKENSIIPSLKKKILYLYAEAASN